MITVNVYDDDKNPIASKRFRSMNRATDYASDVVGNDINAAFVEVGGEWVDCWQLRDKAIANGFELPVHRQMV